MKNVTFAIDEAILGKVRIVGAAALQKPIPIELN